MALNLGGGGEGKPFIRFKPSINAWEMSGENGATEFTWASPAMFDVETIKLGWLLLDTGVREWVEWPANRQTPRPDEREWKQGFICLVYSKAIFGEEASVREYSSSSVGNVEFIKALYNEAETQFGSNTVPVVKMTGARAEKIGKGNTRIPTFEVVKYAPRPAELPADGLVNGSAPAASAAPKAAPPAPPAKAPPVQQAAPADADEF